MSQVVSAELCCELMVNLSSVGFCCAHGFNKTLHRSWYTLTNPYYTLDFLFTIIASDRLCLEQRMHFKELSTLLNVKAILQGRQ